MGKYRSDSDDDKNDRHRSSYRRERDRRRGRSRSRSRSRDRRKRSHRSRSRDRSRDRYSRRSRSRSRDRHKSIHKARRDYKSKRSRSRSRSHSSASDDDRRRRKDRSSRASSSEKKSNEGSKVKEKLKESLRKAESQDQVLKDEISSKIKQMERIIPDADVISSIESSRFVQQSFYSSAGNRATTEDKNEINSNSHHDNAIFGTMLDFTSSTKPSCTTASPTPVIDLADDETIISSTVNKAEEVKKQKWIQKLQKFRSEKLAR